MVILRSQNKITDFLLILAWASPFNGIKIAILSGTIDKEPEDNFCYHYH